MVFFISQHLPDLPGSDLRAGERPADPALLQNQHAVRGQTDALQNMGRKQEGPILLIAAHELVQKFRALKIKPVHRLIQKQQLGPQGKCRNEIGLFQIAGGQFL